MYGARDFSAYLGYGAMRLFQDEILRGHGNLGSQKIFCTGPVLPWILDGPLGKSEFLVSSESIGNLTQKTVGYPSRKGVEHIFFERQKYGQIPAYQQWKNVRYLTSEESLKS